jgi:hypothetical protein
MVSTEDNFKQQQVEMDQDSDCWARLGQLIQTNGSGFLKQVLRTNREERHEKSKTSHQ